MKGELFVELFCEELPASFVRPALAGLVEGLTGLLEGVEHGEVRTWATPRRLAVAIADVAAARPVVEKEVTGPPADRAFVDGKPTATAEGFAASKGVDVSELRVVELPKRGAVVAVTIREGGEPTVDRIASGLADVVAAVPFRKRMVWGEGGLEFARPLHRINVLFNGQVVEGEAHGIAFGATTQGHRLTPGPFTFTSADTWVEGLRAHHVEPDLVERAARIREQLDAAAATLGADPIHDPALAEEVLHLVEWPAAVTASFDEDLLELPHRLLVTSMKVHQRYFPVHRRGRLTHRFVVITNNPFSNAEVVAEGNARVLRARFYDARFFFAEDRARTLDEHGHALEKMRWIRGLGTMADKGRRVADLASALAPWVGADVSHARRAGELCKSDLTTQMVGEFAELQGHMGRLYADAAGEPEAVSLAIEEHYRPASADDDVAYSAAGVAVALADRLDTLVGAFGIGMEPKGGGDPQGLRRAALGIVRTVLAHELRRPLQGLLRKVVSAFHAYARHANGFEAWTKAQGTGEDASGADELVASLERFVLARFKAAKVAEGLSPDVVDAVLATIEGGEVDLLAVDRKLAALASVAGTDDFPAILQTFKRVLNIGAGVDVPVPDAEQATEDVERALLRALAEVGARVDKAATALDYTAALDAMLTLRAPVEAFFEGVLVNADEPSVRALRLGILSAVAATFRRVADFSRISTR